MEGGGKPTEMDGETFKGADQKMMKDDHWGKMSPFIDKKMASFMNSLYKRTYANLYSVIGL